MSVFRSKKYLDIIETDYCMFCGTQNATLVKHHVRIKGTCGAGMKPSDIQVIPVCNVDHDHCHSGLHTMERQTEKLFMYWRERAIQEHGEAKAILMFNKAVKEIVL